MISRPLAVVADEGDVAVALPPGRGLAEVVQEGAEAKRLAAGQLVGERLGQQRLELRRPASPQTRPRSRLDLEQALEDRERVAVDVEVVVGVLLDAAQGLQLGEDRRR